MIPLLILSRIFHTNLPTMHSLSMVTTKASLNKLTSSKNQATHMMYWIMTTLSSMRYFAASNNAAFRCDPPSCPLSQGHLQPK